MKKSIFIPGPDEAELLAAALEKWHRLNQRELPKDHPERIIFVHQDHFKRWEGRGVEAPTHIYGLKVVPLGL